MGALVFVFAFAHRRVWAIIEPGQFGKYKVTIGGDTNRNHAAFDERFAKMVERVHPAGQIGG
jgi:hypothetical protein